MKKLLIIIGLFIAVSINAQIGFPYFDTIPDDTPTTQELIASLTGEQRLAIIDGYALKKSPVYLKHNFGIATAVTGYFYSYINQITNTADELMTNYDLTAGQLSNQVYTVYQSEFTQAQTDAVLSKRIDYSKHDGTGDWAYYKSSFGW